MRLIAYFTVGPKEARAWTISEGTKARAGGRRHSYGFRKGFIRAKTMAYDDYVAGGGEAGAREAGKLGSKARNMSSRTVTSCTSDLRLIAADVTRKRRIKLRKEPATGCSLRLVDDRFANLFPLVVGNGGLSGHMHGAHIGIRRLTVFGHVQPMKARMFFRFRGMIAIEILVVHDKNVVWICRGDREPGQEVKGPSPHHGVDLRALIAQHAAFGCGFRKSRGRFALGPSYQGK